MKTIRFLAFTASLLLAMTFILSCGSHDNDKDTRTQVCSGVEYDADQFACFRGELVPLDDGKSSSSSSRSSFGLSSSSLGVAISSSSSLGSSSSSEAASSSSGPVSLTCANMPATGIAGTPITEPIVSCGTTDVTSEVTWDWAGNPRLRWDLPAAGTYNIRVTGTCDGSLKAASCGTIIVAPPSYGSVIYEGKAYKTVKIGNQTWMAENLNYNVSGSKCGNGNVLSDANTATCNKYGRLYDWATALALPASCNSSSCAYRVNAKHRGICPLGWHIPSEDEWLQFWRSSITGADLRAKGDWPCGTYDWGGDKCKNTYGFVALPGGRGNSDGSYFTDDGINSTTFSGRWWTASEYNEYQNDVAEFKGLNDGGDMYGGISDKSDLFSIRCLQD